MINPVIGEYDNPSAQIQDILTVDLTNIGHLLIYGMAGSGKEHLLTTLIYSTCTTHSPDEVNFYILDFGAETLKIFSKYPQVGGVVTAEDPETMLNMLLYIDKTIDERKKLFSDYGGSYKNYINESQEKLPLLVVILNYFEIFQETNAKLSEAVKLLIREGSKYGVVFIVTTSVNNLLGSRVTQLFLNKISLQQPDEGTYRTLLNSPKGLSPKKYFGRGIAYKNDQFFEFQTAYVGEKEKINKIIREKALELQEKYQSRAKGILKLPNKVTVDMMMDKVTSLSNIPIGYSKDEVETYYYDFDSRPVSLVLSKDIRDKNLFVASIAKEMALINNIDVNIIDTEKIIKPINGVTLLNNNFDAALVEMIKGINKESDELKRVYIIVGFDRFKNLISKEYISYLNSLMTGIIGFRKSKIILVDSYDVFKSLQIEDWYNGVIDSNYGIWLGNNVENQLTLNFDSLTENNIRESFDYIGYVTMNEKKAVIKYVIDEEQD